MTEIVSADRIEQIVGARRHPTHHLGRAVSGAQSVYILHSSACVASGLDLRACTTCPGSPGAARSLVAEAEEFLKSVTTEGGETHG